MFGRPDHSLGADHAGDPLLGHRLLDRQLPGVDEAIVEVLALVAPRAGLGPGLVDEVVSLVEALTVVGRVDVVGQLLAARTAHPAGHQASARDHVDSGQLFGQPQRVGDRQRVAEQDDFNPLGNPSQDSGFDIHDRTATERRLVVLVEHHPVKAQLFGVDALVQIFVHQLATPVGAEQGVGQAKVAAAVSDDFLLRDINVFPFRKRHNMHTSFLLSS